MNERQEKFGSQFSALVGQMDDLLKSLPPSRETAVIWTEWEKTSIIMAAMGLKALNDPPAT